ncbi:hypothetical protein OHU45_04430 [Streptomyces tubercidicus]|uniref:hypothetical protein n=1 Tax=Streptomyces tubercidicus TaxID=47759 RepID=UPI002E0DBE08|nr:hypothetical protein OG761_04245 [Streptomyces tubercidicus]
MPRAPDRRGGRRSERRSRCRDAAAPDVSFAGDHRRTRPPQSGVGGQNLPLADVTRALSHAAGCPDRIESLTIEGAVRRMGPIAEAFALDQQFSGARARRELGWSPTRLDALAELAQG